MGAVSKQVIDCCDRKRCRQLTNRYRERGGNRRFQRFVTGQSNRQRGCRGSISGNRPSRCTAALAYARLVDRKRQKGNIEVPKSRTTNSQKRRACHCATDLKVVDCPPPIVLANHSPSKLHRRRTKRILDASKGRSAFTIASATGANPRGDTGGQVFIQIDWIDSRTWAVVAGVRRIQREYVGPCASIKSNIERAYLRILRPKTRVEL